MGRSAQRPERTRKQFPVVQSKDQFQLGTDLLSERVVASGLVRQAGASVLRTSTMSTLGAKTIGPFSTLRHRLIVLIQEATMRQYKVYEFDNRDSAQVYQYMEARIEALKRRIEQLEAEKKARSSDLHCAQIKSSAA